MLPLDHAKTLRHPFLATLLGTLVVLMSAPSASASASHPPPSINIQAQASMDVEPDKATLKARLWEHTSAVAQRDSQTQDSDALAEARQRLEQRASELIGHMEEIGLARDAINAGSLNIRPEHVNGPSQSNERETLVRTRLERPIEVALNDLERLEDILDALVDAGVNSLDGVQFDLKDREAATDEALVKALEKARHKAQLMADTLNITLGEITQVQETQSPVFAPRMMSIRADSMESSGTQAEYHPGIIRIDAGVNVQWAITEKAARPHPGKDAAAQE